MEGAAGSGVFMCAVFYISESCLLCLLSSADSKSLQ